ncbi:hypothetical protein [Salinicoccus roseus]|nr:hypothetical protein [Salinicoccus roseus]
MNYSISHAKEDMSKISLEEECCLKKADPEALAAFEEWVKIALQK